MPGAPEGMIDRLEAHLKEITSITTLLNVGNTPEMILEHVLGEFGLEINDRVPVEFYCNCTKERVEKALISVETVSYTHLYQPGGHCGPGTPFDGRRHDGRGHEGRGRCP